MDFYTIEIQGMPGMQLFSAQRLPHEFIYTHLVPTFFSVSFFPLVGDVRWFPSSFPRLTPQ